MGGLIFPAITSVPAIYELATCFFGKSLMKIIYVQFYSAISQ